MNVDESNERTSERASEMNHALQRANVIFFLLWWEFRLNFFRLRFFLLAQLKATCFQCFFLSRIIFAMPTHRMRLSEHFICIHRLCWMGRVAVATASQLKDAINSLEMESETNICHSSVFLLQHITWNFISIFTAFKSVICFLILGND